MGVVIVTVTINETIQYLLDIQDLTHPTSIYQIGSSTLPYLDNYHDIDLLFIVPNHSRVAWNKYLHYCKRNHITDIDVHICEPNDYLGLQTYPYLMHYAYLLYGQPDMQIDIFESSIKHQVIIHWFNQLKEINPYSKLLYHLYTMLCFWQHGDYILTDREIKNINYLHDRSTPDEIRRNLYWQTWSLFWPYAKKVGFDIGVIDLPDVRRYIQKNFSETEW